MKLLLLTASVLLSLQDAENPEYKPIEVDLRRDTLVIEGVAVGVIRNGKTL